MAGATKENVEKHGCFYEDYSICADGEVLTFGIISCALCQNNLCQNNSCCNCPVVLSGRPSCNRPTSEYVASDNDPAAMIAVLEDLLERY